MLRPTSLRRVVLGASAVLALGVAGTGAALAARPPHAPPPAVTLELGTAPSAPRACERVRWRFRVVNRSATPVELVFSTGQRGDVVLSRGGRTVHRWSARRSFTQALWRRMLVGGSAWRFELADSVRLAPGRYALTARLTASPSEGGAKLSLRRAFDLRPGRRTCTGATGTAGAAPPPAPTPPPASPPPPAPAPPPPSPSPPVPGDAPVRPPAAILTGAGGETRLAYGSYCWALGLPSGRGIGVCADMIQPALRTDIPRVTVRAGEQVTIRLAFQPEWIAIFFSAPGATRRIDTPLEASVTWEVPADLGTDARLLVVAAEGSAGAQGFGQATYLAWLVPSPTG